MMASVNEKLPKAGADTIITLAGYEHRLSEVKLLTEDYLKNNKCSNQESTALKAKLAIAINGTTRVSVKDATDRKSSKHELMKIAGKYLNDINEAIGSSTENQMRSKAHELRSMSESATNDSQNSSVFKNTN